MHYVVTPFRLALAGIPCPADGALPITQPEEERWEMPATLDTGGVRTNPTSISAARREAEALLQACQTQVAAGRPSAILDLLDMNPEFIWHAWVRAILVRFLEKGLSRRRGRPIGRDKVNPMVVVGIVWRLIEVKEVASPEQAFGWIEEKGLLTYASAKDSFYRAWREQRFKPIFLEWPELAQVLSEEEGAAWLQRAEVLKPGDVSRRRVSDPKRGVVDIELRGL